MCASSEHHSHIRCVLTFILRKSQRKSLDEHVLLDHSGSSLTASPQLFFPNLFCLYLSDTLNMKASLPAKRKRLQKTAGLLHGFVPLTRLNNSRRWVTSMLKNPCFSSCGVSCLTWRQTQKKEDSSGWTWTSLLPNTRDSDLFLCKTAQLILIRSSGYTVMASNIWQKVVMTELVRTKSSNSDVRQFSSQHLLSSSQNSSLKKLLPLFSIGFISEPSKNLNKRFFLEIFGASSTKRMAATL